MNRIFLVIVMIGNLLFVGIANSQRLITPQVYIDTYKEIAVSEMKRSGIPASITLAQGMLESNNGNSSLAKEGNNHFGIKCHDWTGKKMYKDDDEKNECFRKYKSSEESFRDHTDFLLSRQRYNFLFEYKSDDYKSWAKGLKKAGYATNPRYPELLIKLIEDNKLYLYDKNVAISVADRAKSGKSASGKRSEEPDFTIKLKAHPIYKRNNVEYTVVKSGDSFEKLSRELDMFVWEILKYNELTKDSVLHEGDIIYLQPKRRRAERGKEIHTVQPGETLHSISQLYGVKTKQLRKFNYIAEGQDVTDGEVLNLRSKKR